MTVCGGGGWRVTVEAMMDRERRVGGVSKPRGGWEQPEGINTAKEKVPKFGPVEHFRFDG